MPGETKNFKLPVALGTDNYNHLTIDNAAWSMCDTQLYKNQNAAVQSCEESTTGSVHALTAIINTATVFKFIATSDYRNGDTFTFNGSPITARLSNGKTLPDYAYRIGNSVLLIQGGGILTFIVPSLTLLDAYPVGSIYINTGNVNPANLFGGSWSKLKDTFLLASGDAYSAGEKGGSPSQKVEFSNGYASIGFKDSATNKLAISRGGKTFNAVNSTNLSAAFSGDIQSDVPAATLGGEQTLNNLPPYLVVNIWYRTM